MPAACRLLLLTGEPALLLRVRRLLARRFRFPGRFGHLRPFGGRCPAGVLRPIGVAHGDLPVPQPFPGGVVERQGARQVLLLRLELADGCDRPAAVEPVDPAIVEAQFAQRRLCLAHFLVGQGGGFRSAVLRPRTVAGRVAALGEGVTGFSVGQPVIGMCGTGGYAERVVLEARRAKPRPDGIDGVIAAAIPVAYGTAHLGLHQRARLQPGETLLVHGASGGVGLAAVQVG